MSGFIRRAADNRADRFYQKAGWTMIGTSPRGGAIFRGAFDSVVAPQRPTRTPPT